MADQPKQDPSKPRDPRDEQIQQLQSENENLRAQLSAAVARPAAPHRAAFQLSEGQRQELELTGATTGPGGKQLTAADARRLVAKNPDQRKVEINTSETVDALSLPDRGPAVYGVDYVYPSTEPGVLAPEVIGRPGISGSELQ